MENGRQIGRPELGWVLPGESRRPLSLKVRALVIETTQHTCPRPLASIKSYKISMNRTRQVCDSLTPGCFGGDVAGRSHTSLSKTNCTFMK